MRIAPPLGAANVAHRASATAAKAPLCAQEYESANAARTVQPRLLRIDEVGYLSYDSRYADLLFEVVTRRYDGPRSIVLSTNKPFAEWSEVFPHAAWVLLLAP